MNTYRKSIAKGSFDHRFYKALGFPPMSDEGDTPLVLRITLGDMELLDGFYMSLPPDIADASIENMLGEYVLCQSEEGRMAIRRKLAAETNPDLLDIYDSLLWLYEQAEAGDVSIAYHINNGDSDVSPSDPVSLYQQTCTTDDGCSYNLLDLALEIYDNTDSFSEMPDEQKETMLRDFRGVFILYLMDKFGHQPETLYTKNGCLSAVLAHLASEDVELLRFAGEWVITPKGSDLLSGIIAEAEFYINNYDLFADVYVKRANEIIFNTGHGDNLVAPVFMRDGIEPYRAIFVVALYLGNLDHFASDPTMLFSEQPFRQLFSLISCSPTVEDVGAELLDRIIHEGKAKVEEQQLREQRLKHIESIQKRIDSEQ